MINKNTPQQMPPDLSSDPEISAHERDERLNRRFALMRASLAYGKSSMWDLQHDDLALNTVDLVAKILRQGRPSREVLQMLADYLETVDANTASHILGVRRKGRVKSDYWRARAAAVFEMSVAEGMEDDAALVVAYDTYFAHQNRSHKGDAARPIDQANGSKFTNHAEQALEEIIKPMLRRSGALDRRRPGRPRKSLAKK